LLLLLLLLLLLSVVLQCCRDGVLQLPVGQWQQRLHQGLQGRSSNANGGLVVSRPAA
jgi:hypothetical protein